MGLDLKRSDTPKVVQTFLSDILLSVLTNGTKEEIIAKICDFKKKFDEMNPWDKGTPKRVNNLTIYGNKADQRSKGFIVEGRTGMPGHVRAAINWNNLRSMHGDNFSAKIIDGMKIIVCKLRSNPMGYNSVAYPIDVLHVPQWFIDLPFDDDNMSKAIIDKKVENLLGILSWDLINNTQIKSTFNSLFSFD